MNNLFVNSVHNRGRPLGNSSDTKQAITLAASSLFGTLGYDKTTIRLIAKTAGVDPKLVSHYFGSKASLFALILRLPAQADKTLKILKNAPPETWGTQIAEVLIGAEGMVVIPQIVGVIKSASSDPFVASSLQEFSARNSLEPILDALGLPNSKVRASILSSLLVGLTFSDQILGIPLGTRIQALERKNLIAKIIQTILTEDLN